MKTRKSSATIFIQTPQDILQIDDIDLKILFKKYEILKVLRSHEQTLLSRIIIKFLMSENLERHIGRYEMTEISNAIVKLFPTETADIYFIPSYGHVQSKGKIYTCYTKLRSQLQKVGLVKKRTKMAKQVDVVERQRLLDEKLKSYAIAAEEERRKEKKMLQKLKAKKVGTDALLSVIENSQPASMAELTTELSDSNFDDEPFVTYEPSDSSVSFKEAPGTFIMQTPVSYANPEKDSDDKQIITEPVNITSHNQISPSDSKKRPHSDEIESKAKKFKKHKSSAKLLIDKLEEILNMSENADDITGLNVANELKLIPNDINKSYAKKLITDIIFGAQFGRVSKYTEINFNDVKFSD